MSLGPHTRRTRRKRTISVDIGDEFVGWLCLGSDTPSWFHEEDEAVLQLAARILAPRVAGWSAKAELRGAWR